MTASGEEVTELPSSPGARLRREREARGLSEQQAAEALNLDPTVITVLEANDFGALGAPVFVKGHLRRYAHLLALGEDEIIGAYERSKQQLGEPTLVPKARLEMAPVRGRPRWPWVVGGTAAFLVAAALLAYVSENGLPWSAEPADEPAAGVTLPGESAETSSAPVGQEIGPAGAATGSATTPATIPAQTPGTTPGSAPVSGTTAPTTVASAPATPVAPPAAGQVTLQLRFSADSWVEIFDGSGKAVLYDLGKSGSERTLTATAPLSVTLGNAPAVTVAVNGRSLPPPAAQGAIARFSIGADGTLH